MRSNLRLCIVLAVWTCATSASAQSAAERSTAQALFDEGIKLYNAGNYTEACPKFEESLKLVDGLGTRGKLAECYEQVGRVASAWAMYREVAALAQQRGEGIRQKVANERALKLEANLSYIVVKVPSGEGAATRVVRNGVEIGSGAFSTPIAVDPGAHEIVASAPGYKETTLTVQVEPKARVVVEIPVLEKLPPPPDPEPGVSTSGTPMNVSQTAPQRAAWRTPTAIGLVAGGGAITVAGLLVGLSASSKWDSAFEGDDPQCDAETNLCSQEGKDITDSARSRATWSTILVSGGLVVAGAGVVLWLWPDGDDSSDSAVSLTPVVGPRDAGFALTGRF